MKILRYLRRTTSLVLILLLLLTTFSGCVSSPKTFYDYEDQFYAELEKIPKEVEGYALVETGEEQDWASDVLIIGEDEYSFDCHSYANLVIRKNDELFKDVFFFDHTSAIMQKIFSVYDNFDNDLMYKGRGEIIGHRCIDAKLFVLVCTFKGMTMQEPFPNAVKWWPPLLFEYDIDNDVFKYAGFFDMRGESFNIPEFTSDNVRNILKIRLDRTK